MTTSDEASVRAASPAAAAPRGDAFARGVAAASVQAPAWILALLAAAVPLFWQTHAEDQVVIPRLAATGVLTGLACIAVASSAGRPVRWRVAEGPLLLLLALVLWSALATAAGLDIGNSLMGEARRYQGLLPLLMYAALMVAAMVATARLGSPRVLLAGVFIGGVLAALDAVLQRFDAHWLLVHIFREPAAGWYGLPVGRYGASFAQPNVLGAELVTAGLASFGLWRDAPAVQRNLLAIGWAVMLAALLFTYSRGAWVGLVVGLIVLGTLFAFERDALRARVRAGFRQREALRAAAPYVVGAVAMVAVLAGTMAILPGGRRAYARAASAANPHDASISAHTGLWWTSMKMIRDRPLVGGGPESFSTIFAAYRTPDQPEFGTSNVRPESSHNYFIDQAVGLGIPGLAIVVALIGGTMIAGLRATRGDGRARWYAIALCGAIAGYYVTVFFSYGEAMTGWLPWLLMGALLGVAVSAAREPVAADHRAEMSLRRAEPFVRAGALAFGVVLVAAAALVFEADRLAAQAGTLSGQHEYAAAADRARQASKLNPLDRAYLYDVGAYEESAADTDPTALGRALDAYHTVDARFAATTFGVLGEARVMARMYASGQPVDINKIDALLVEGARLDPYNADAQQQIASIHDIIGDARTPSAGGR
ncbi:MAG TPA: O-antigen ligase family protein [Dehalococcoidia bacterium]|nr:O-antigen ligase family protein [Dehalococcoidia bacterium]